LDHSDVSGLARTVAMKDRLLVQSRYSRLGASTILRNMQYQPWLEDAGFNVEYAALFDDDYLQKLYSRQKSKNDLLRYYRKRISKLQQRPNPKLAWIEYETLPWLPWTMEKALLPTSFPFASDYDDAVFHRYDRNKFASVR